MNATVRTKGSQAAIVVANKVAEPFDYKQIMDGVALLDREHTIDSRQASSLLCAWRRKGWLTVVALGNRSERQTYRRTKEFPKTVEMSQSSHHTAVVVDDPDPGPAPSALELRWRDLRAGMDIKLPEFSVGFGGHREEEAAA